MKKHITFSLLLALSGTATAEDLYRAVIDFPNPPGPAQSFTGVQLPLSELTRHMNPMCAILPETRGRFVKVSGGGDIPFDCAEIRAKKNNEPSKQEADPKGYLTYTLQEGEWKKGSTYTSQLAMNYMRRACLKPHIGAVKIVDPTGKETVHNCAEWRAANPIK